MFYQLILLASQRKIQKERSISAVYYLIKGKQSIQTIQDAELFRLSRFYGIYKNLTKHKFFDTIDQLVKEQYLQNQAHDNYYKLTFLGEKWLRNNEVLWKDLYVNGKKYKQIDHIYFSRLLLLVQVWTNSYKSHFKFIPIIENNEVERWVKSYYQFTKDKINYYLLKLYEELVELLSLLPTSHAEMFISQLTGYKTIGMTTEQLMNTFQMSKEDVHITTVSIVHFILAKVSAKNEKYPVLYAISDNLHSNKHLTESAKITNNFLNSGLTISQIANRRHLKLNTIYDHIVEIALHDEHFSLTTYVKESYQQQIIEAIDHIHSFKLKDIKNAVSEEITYFHIRLVLAKLNQFNLRGEEAETTK